MEKTWELKDYSKLIKEFEKLSETIQKKHAWGAVRRGAQVIADRAKSNVKRIDDPSTPINIADFIYPQRATKIAKSQKAVAYRIGVRGGAVYENGVRITPTYWRFVELGTEKIAARPFLRPAIEEDPTAVVSAIADSLEKRIAKEVK